MLKLDLYASVIEEYIKNNNLSNQQFCDLCGIGKGSLKNIFKGKMVRLSTVHKIFLNTGICITDLIKGKDN